MTEEIRKLSQGFHKKDDIYRIVNGTDTFEGMVQGDRIQWAKKEFPILHVKADPWAEDLTLDKLNGPPPTGLEDLYGYVLDILRIGWMFKDQELDTSFLAADLLYTPVASAFGHMVWTMINGPMYSGKTCLVKGLLTGGNLPEIRLCEASRSYDDYSAEALAAVADGSSLRVVLDEFEDNGDEDNARTKATRNILELLRNIPKGGLWYPPGGADRPHDVPHRLCFPGTVANTGSPHETTDLTRFVVIHTVPVQEMRGPEDSVLDQYDPEDLQDMRQDITLAAIVNAVELSHCYEEVKKEFDGNAGLPEETFIRLKNNLLPSTAILKFIGQDYKHYLSEMCRVKMAGLLKEK